MSAASADRRKIRQLEDSLEESEKAKKKFERENQRLTRDLKELQDKLDAIEKTGNFSITLQFTMKQRTKSGLQKRRRKYWTTNHSKDKSNTSNRK